MAIIRFKSRSLIRRFGSDPVRVSDSLAKQYTDRGQAIEEKAFAEEEVPKIEEVIPNEETSPEEKEEAPDEDQDSEEEQIELKITTKKKK